MTLTGGIKSDALLVPLARTTTGGGTGTAVDTQGYANAAVQEFAVILNVGGITGTQGTLDVTVEESTTTGSGFTTIGTFAQVTTTTGAQTLHVKNTKRYVRAVGTTGGTSPNMTYGVLLVGKARVV